MTSRQDRALVLLKEQHKAMTDVMALRRISETSAQRTQAENAIAVWRKVKAFFAEQVSA